MDKGKFLSLKVPGFQVTDKMQMGQTDQQSNRLAGLQSNRLADLKNGFTIETPKA